MTEVKTISDLIQFQDGSVVSKEILRRSTGTITLFAFSEGEGLSEHTAPYDAVVQAIEGSAQITVSGRVHQIEVGQILILPAHNPHSVKALTPFKMLLTMIRA